MAQLGKSNVAIEQGMRCFELEAELENLSGTGYEKYPISPKTSGAPHGYNCIAFAAGFTNRWWWPSPNKILYYWPPHLPREKPNQETLQNFINAFEWLGYERCSDEHQVTGIEKVAIFLKDSLPTHAARQLENRLWISKCGSLQDIQHETLAAVEGCVYGRASVFLQRKR